MTLDVAILDVRPDTTREFEAAFRVAERIIASMAGNPILLDQHV